MRQRKTPLLENSGVFFSPPPNLAKPVVFKRTYDKMKSFEVEIDANNQKDGPENSTYFSEEMGPHATPANCYSFIDTPHRRLRH